MCMKSFIMPKRWIFRYFIHPMQLFPQISHFSVRVVIFTQFSHFISNMFYSIESHFSRIYLSLNVHKSLLL